MRFDRLSIEEGLSQSAVQAIAQDNTGFIWFATENGLDRYNGYEFKHYRRDSDSAGALTNDFINDLAIDDEGGLWLATDGGGVARWDPNTDTFALYRHNPDDRTTIASDNIHVVLSDPLGAVWIGTRQDGLDRVDLKTGSISHYQIPGRDVRADGNEEINTLAIDNVGMIWVGTNSGLLLLDPITGHVSRYNNDPADPTSLSEDRVRTLLVGSDGAVWAGTQQGGLNRFRPATKDFHRYVHNANDPATLGSNRVETLLEDSEQRIWVGTSGGLNLLNTNTGTFTRYTHDATDPSSLGGDNVISLFQDRSGVLWVGTKTRGVSKWNPRSWSFGHVGDDKRTGDGLSSLNVTSFAEDQSGKLWIGTFDGGLNIFDRTSGAIDHLGAANGADSNLMDNRVMALSTSATGHIWVGTMGGGLSYIDPATLSGRTYRNDPNDPTSLANDGIMTLLEDSKGRVWAGTFGGGVSRLDRPDGGFLNFAPEPGNSRTLSSGRATAIIEGHDGRIWVGTDGGGLNVFDEKTAEWRRFLHNPDDASSLSANTVYSLHVDANGDLWVGTRAGLDRAVLGGNNKIVLFESVTQDDGLANEVIYGIRSDRSGNLWLSTNYGLARYNPATGAIRNFHSNHGLQGEEFNFGAHFSNSRGELFFGGGNGFNLFNPDDLGLNSNPPQIALTSFAKFNQPVDSEAPYELLSEIDLAHSDDVVTFEFSALDFVAPNSNQYAYRLEGFDKNWVEAGGQRRITYTNLDGGNYVLRVKAANSDGVWSDREIAIPVHVDRPPWATWWAYTLYTLFLVLSLYLFFRHQRRKLIREAEYSRRLETEVRERTQELAHGKQQLAERNGDLELANQQLQKASSTDSLTGLGNRRHLFTQIPKDAARTVRRHAAALARNEPECDNDLIFIVVDLDNFKPVNDRYGHLAGDQMLLQVKDVLLSVCRSTDDVIRWGGDEFLIVCRDADRGYAEVLVERVRSRIADRAYALGQGNMGRTSTSIGYACYPFLKDNPKLLSWEQVLGIADAAMYYSKEHKNAWTGIYGAHWAEGGDALLKSIKKDPRSLAESGTIDIVRSLSLADAQIA